MKKDEAARFWSRVDRTGSCHLWRGRHVSKKDGLAYTVFRGVVTTVQRVAYLLTTGKPVPPNRRMVFCPKSKLCCNLKHIKLRVTKPQVTLSKNAPKAVMTPSTFQAVRQWNGLTQKAAAEKIGVHPITVARWETGVAPIMAKQAKLIRRGLSLPPGA